MMMEILHLVFSTIDYSNQQWSTIFITQELILNYLKNSLLAVLYDDGNFLPLGFGQPIDAKAVK